MRGNRKQTSETFILSALLSLSGGFQDAYTYNLRGRVFANAQTGNVVLMSQHFMSGEWKAGMHYLLPVIAFAFGIFIAERIAFQYKNARKLHWRQIVLLIEMLVLSAVGFIPSKWNTLANILVSFSCAMQVQSFRKMDGYGYASTMCIGNLRSGTESLSVYFREREKGELIKALHYYGIIFIFAVGAGSGGILSGILGLKSIFISCALLLIAYIMMYKEKL